MSTRQGSASYGIVIAGVMAVVTGALVLTFVTYPMLTAFRGASFWSADTAGGARVLTYVGGMWEFTGGFMLIALLAFIWITTRQ